MLDNDSSFSSYILAGWKVAGDDVGVGAVVWLGQMCQVGIVITYFWWLVQLGDVPARWVLFLKPFMWILNGVLKFNTFMTEKGEKYIKKLTKANKVVKGLGGNATNAYVQVVGEVKRRGSGLGLGTN